MKNEKKFQTETLAVGALMTALVAVLQLVGSFIRFGPFSVSLVLVPIVIGASLCGWKIGAWLGFVFGVMVLLSGDAAAFLAVSVPGTVATVLLKGILCGAAAGAVYKLLERKHRYPAVVLSAIICPIVNTGVFFIGCALFFMDTLAGWASSIGFGDNVVRYMLLGLAGGNFLFEMGANIILSPIVVRILDIVKRKKADA